MEMTKCEGPGYHWLVETEKALDEFRMNPTRENGDEVVRTLVREAMTEGAIAGCTVLEEDKGQVDAEPRRGIDAYPGRMSRWFVMQTSPEKRTGGWRHHVVVAADMLEGFLGDQGAEYLMVNSFERGGMEIARTPILSYYVKYVRSRKSRGLPIRSEARDAGD